MGRCCWGIRGCLLWRLGSRKEVGWDLRTGTVYCMLYVICGEASCCAKKMQGGERSSK